MKKMRSENMLTLERERIERRKQSRRLKRKRESKQCRNLGFSFQQVDSYINDDSKESMI